MRPWDEQVWESIDKAVERFEHSLQSGGEVDLASLVPPPSNPHHLPVLSTLVKVELEARWERGARPRLEAYLQQWPELEEDDETLLDLIAAECRIRRHHGESPHLSETQQRFPHLADHAEFASLTGDSKQTSEVSHEIRVSSSLLESIGTGTLFQPLNQENPALQRGSKLGRFDVLAVLGRGGMGTVYLARDDQLQRSVAIKLLHPWIHALDADTNLLLSEARAAAKVRHPSIVPVHDVGQRDDGSYYFVMEYIDGQSLRDVIEGGPLAPDLAVDIALQMTDALATAHQHELVHRDVKPENTLLESDGRVRLSDFGLALTQQNRQKAGSNLSGTVPYMAPEQVRGESESYDHRVDVWALGVVLYEMLTGQRPFVGETADDVANAVLRREPSSPSQLNQQIPAELGEICLKCLQKEPSRRFASMREVGEALHVFRNKVSKRKRGYLGFVAVSLLAAIALAVTAWWPEASSTAPPGLEDCGLVFTARTGARVDLNAARDFVSYYPGRLFPASILRVNTTRHDQIHKQLQRDKKRPDSSEWLTWTLPLQLVEQQHGFAAGSPVTLKLKCAVNRRGDFHLGTVSPNTTDHLIVLAALDGLNNYEQFGKDFLLPQGSSSDPPKDAFSQPSGIQQNLLARWFGEMYESFYRNDIVRGGPRNFADLYQLPMNVANRLGSDLYVVRAAVQVERTVPWHGDRYGEIRRQRNCSLIPDDADKISFVQMDLTMECKQQDRPALLLLSSSADDHTRSSSENGARFEARGIQRDAGQSSPSEIETISKPNNPVTWAGMNGTSCVGGNWGIAKVLARLHDQYPESVRLEVYADYSAVRSQFAFATTSETEGCLATLRYGKGNFPPSLAPDAAHLEDWS
ncbi:MAG: serine/threonine-protein kinase, partial [Planctomycetota bacterium]